MILSSDYRLPRAETSLLGLSIGDAFGECFFTSEERSAAMLEARSVPEPIWRYTDDTQMALSIVSILRQYGAIEADRLAGSFATYYDYTRGYGPAMHRLLHEIRLGVSWRDAAPAQFSGQGSYGNGAAMRSAPIGAYFADDLERVREHAAQSAVITHTHPEAVTGAVAVAIATALASQISAIKQKPSGAEFLEQVVEWLPVSQVKSRIVRAKGMLDASVQLAVYALGNGVELAAHDTVPYALWCVANHLFDYEDALWLAVSALGDRDTICAIVGGIVVMSAGVETVPQLWQKSREPLPEW